MRPVWGNAELTRTTPGSASASRRASITGPILPRSVESKVEQTLNRMWRAPLAFSQAWAGRAMATASCGSMERLFRATTTASASGSSRSSAGVPMVWIVRRPARVRALARSDEPV